MTLRAGHELLMALSLLSALLCFVSQAHLPVLTWPLLGTPLISGWLKLSGHRLSEWFGILVAVLGLGVGAVWWVFGGSDELVRAVGSGLMLVMTSRLLTRDVSAHDLQLLSLALVLVAASTVLADGPGIMVGVTCFITCGLAALMTREIVAGAESEMVRTGSRLPLRLALARRDLVTLRFGLWAGCLGAAILCGAALLFVLFPRGPQALPKWMVPRGWSLPQRVSLQTGGSGATTSQTIARISGLDAADFYAGLYLRGAVYDGLRVDGFFRDEHFDWLHVIDAPLMRSGPKRAYEVFLEPSGTDLLLTLGSVLERDIAGVPGSPSPHAFLAAQGELRGRELGGMPQRYRVSGSLMALGTLGSAAPQPEAVLSARLFEHYTALPAARDPRIAALAARQAADARSDAHKVTKMRDFLRGHARYSHNNVNAAAQDPLAAFLFVRPEGHCEYFAMALAFMLRGEGIPCRLVGGYQGGEWDTEAHRVSFSAEHAHVWVEWFAPGVGWVAEDATPQHEPQPLRGWGKWHERLRRLWDDHVTSFGLTEQLFFAHHLGSWLRWPSWHEATRGVLGSSRGFSLARSRSLWLGALPGCVVASTFAWLVRVRWRRRRAVARLGRLLWARLAQHATRPLKPADSWEGAYRAVVPSMWPEDAPQAKLLRQALSLYQACRFGRRPTDPQILHTIALLRRF